MVHGPFLLHLQSKQWSICKSNSPLSPPHSTPHTPLLLLPYLPLTMTILLPLVKTHCDYTGPTQIIKDNLLISRPVTYSHLQNLLYNEKFLGIRTWTSLRGHSAAYHTHQPCIMGQEAECIELNGSKKQYVPFFQEMYDLEGESDINPKTTMLIMPMRIVDCS